MNIEERTTLRVLNSQGKFVNLPNLQKGVMTTNTNGYETLTFSFLAPVVYDNLPVTIKNWVGMIVPYLGGQMHGEFFIAEIKIPGGLEPGQLGLYQVTCYGLQHIVKTNVPVVAKNFTGGTAAGPEVICQDSVLGGIVLTALGLTTGAYVVDATGITISQKIDLTKNRTIGDWFDEILAYGNGTYRWDWAVWADPNYGIRDSAKRTQIYLTKRDHLNPVYYVERSAITIDAPMVSSFNQYWDKASFVYQSLAGAQTIASYTPPAGTLPTNMTCWTPDGSIPLTHTYVGDLGIPGGDTTVTVSPSQVTTRAQAEFAADLTYRLTASTITINPGDLTDSTGHIIPNETVRAGRLLRIRNYAITRSAQFYIDLFITQTSLDLNTGQLTITPQTATDFKTAWSNPYKHKGSAHKRHHRNINPT